MEAAVVPRLETPRLILRGWGSDDADAHAAMTSEPEVMRHLGGVLTAAQSWRALAQHAGHWVLRGYGPWAIERQAWGHGYATVAARAALEWTWASTARGYGPE